MNTADTEFEILTTPVKRKGLFKFKVEVIYQSDVVERYRLTGGQKIMILEKRIENIHSWKNWKVLDLNFEFRTIDEWTIATLHHLYKLIDEKRFGRRLVTYRPPHERNGWFNPEDEL